jgi:diguanylate cyclase (GGDEF)-like protein
MRKGETTMNDLNKGKCLSSMMDILAVLKSINKHEEVFSRIIDAIAGLYPCQSCAFVMIEPKTEYLKIRTNYGISHTFQKAFHRPISTGAIGALLWKGKPIVVTDRERQLELSEEVQLEHRCGSCVCLQVSADHRTLGYLFVDSKMPQSFSEEDVHVLQAFADLAGTAYYKCWLAEENMILDQTDHETGLESYLAFQGKLHTAMDRAEQFQEPFSVMICDVDNFKKVGRTYGYEATRELLKEMGNLVKCSIRTIDVAGRYGSDEFILLRANTDVEESEQFAGRLCKEVETTSFTSKGISSTISIGVAGYPTNGKTIDDIVLTAKKALFEAQRIGRNTIIRLPGVWHAREVV